MTGKGIAGVILMVMVAFGVLTGTSTADWGKPETQVYCYIGFRDNNQYLGTVDVFDPPKAAAYCNMMYNDCNGNCTGCFDDEAAQEICIGSSGAPFYHY